MRMGPVAPLDPNVFKARMTGVALEDELTPFLPAASAGLRPRVFSRANESKLLILIELDNNLELFPCLKLGPLSLTMVFSTI